MLRDPALVPLSRQHQHALAICVRIQRALTPDATAEVASWEQEVEALFSAEIQYHFASEEEIIFPAAAKHAELHTVVEELRREHAALRDAVQAAAERRLGSAGLVEFASALSSHIRKEERQLFEEMQRLLTPDELHTLGSALDAWFALSGMPGPSCALPRASGSKP